MKEYNIDNLTFGQIKELQSLVAGVSNQPHRFNVGESYLIRTVTMILVGRIEWVGDKEIELSSASWVADTGRFYDALKSGKLNEVEPFTNNVLIGRGSLIDATIWTHALPKEQK